MDDKIFETFQTFCQYGTRAGDVPTHEAFAFLAVHGSGIEPKPGFPGQAVFQFGRRRSQCTAVHPHQISTLQFANRKVRKVFRAEFFHVPVIPLQVCQQLVEPVLPLAVCGYGGDYSERIDVAHLVDVDGFVDSAAYFFVRSHDVGDLQSCDVECFAGGYAGDGMSRECC